MNNLKTLLVSNPTLKISEVDNSSFKNHQKFGGIKASITVNRKLFNSYIELNKSGLKTLANELNVSEYLISKYAGKKPISIEKSKLLVESLESYDFSDIKNFVKSKNEPKTTPKVEEVVIPKRFDGVKKRNIRDIFIAHIKLTKGKFFTLPSDTCYFEKQLNATIDNKFHYVACENVPNVFERLQATVTNSKLFMSTIFGEAKETLDRATENEFSNMNIDYCGTFPTFNKEVSRVILNNVVKVGGLIGLTFTTREANVKEEPSKTFNKKVNDIVNSDGVENVKDGIKIKLLAYMGNDYEFLEYVSYFTNQTMVFALIRRIK